MTEAAPPLDYDKVRKFLGRAVDDVGTATLGALSYIGDRLGLFKVLASGGPVTVADLAKKTKLKPRYLREWLNGMTASRYIDYDPATEAYSLPPEHALILSDETSPFFLGGFLEMIVP